MKSLDTPCKGDGYVLETGRILHCNSGILGIDPSDMSLTQGYDGHVFEYPCVDIDADDFKPLTHDEKIEIALHMIELWDRWRRS